MSIWDFRVLVSMTAEEINNIDFGNYIVNDLCKYDSRTLMQIFLEFHRVINVEHD